MPIEIRELVIKVTVSDGKKDTDTDRVLEHIKDIRDKIVNECIEKVTAHLESLPER